MDFEPLVPEPLPSVDYQPCLLAERRPWLSVAGSAAGHSLLLACVVYLLPALIPPGDVAPGLRVVGWQSLRVPTDRVVFFAPPAQIKPPVVPSQGAVARLTRSSRPAGGSPAELARIHPPGVRFEMPPAATTGLWAERPHALAPFRRLSENATAIPPIHVPYRQHGEGDGVPAIGGSARPVRTAPLIDAAAPPLVVSAGGAVGAMPQAPGVLAGSVMVRPPEPPPAPAGGTAASGVVAPAVPGMPGPPVRIIHADNSEFDVVIVQTAVTDAEVRTSLQWEPVYTAYLDSGSPKNWVLHYGLPGTAAAKPNARVITLEAPAKVAGPAPRVTVFPPQEFLLRQLTRTLLHGFITASGQFRELSPVKAEKWELARQLLPLLEEWRFRPAMRNGEPVEVEIVLGIPSYASSSQADH